MQFQKFFTLLQLLVELINKLLELIDILKEWI